MTRHDINDVKRFWNSNPLFSNDNENTPDNKTFFENHDRAVINDSFVGEKEISDKILYPNANSVFLDLCCGVGFWSSFFDQRLILKKIYAVDISEVSISISQKRLESSQNKINFTVQNAESLNFHNEFFDHVNCQGAIHHTPEPNKVISEIYRVLKHGGTASLSVYYENFFLKNYKFFKFLMTPFLFMIKYTGRGRNFNKLPQNCTELVRTYDGKDNPIGICYSTEELKNLIKIEDFQILKINYHFFPSRFLKIKIPNLIRQILGYFLPFMIIINIKKN